MLKRNKNPYRFLPSDGMSTCIPDFYDSVTEKKKKRAPSQGITATEKINKKKKKKYRDGFIIHKPEVLQNYIVL